MNKALGCVYITCEDIDLMERKIMYLNGLEGELCVVVHLKGFRGEIDLI